MTQPLTRYSFVILVVMMYSINIALAQGQACTVEYGAEVVSGPFFDQPTCGEDNAVTVVLRNTGTKAWQRITDPNQGPGDVGFFLRRNPPDFELPPLDPPFPPIVGGSLPSEERLQIGELEVIECNETKEFTFHLNPLETSDRGYHYPAFVYQMVDEWDTFFGDFIWSDAFVGCPDDPPPPDCEGINWDSDLAWVNQPPIKMECGQEFDAQLIAQNTGLQTWTTDAAVQLAARVGANEFSVSAQSLPGGVDVVCQDTTTFNIPITAPYVNFETSSDLHLQMRRNNSNGWFGDSSLAQSISVVCNVPIPGDDELSICGDKAIVDVLANDINTSGVELPISMGVSNCPGPVVNLGNGLFDVSESLAAESDCNFEYQTGTGALARFANVTLHRGLACSVPDNNDVPLLSVHPINKRYFINPEGDAVYLAGAHVWQNLQDYGPGNPPTTSCNFNQGEAHNCGVEEWQYLRARGHNFTRGWHWEQEQGYEGTTGYTTRPIPYLKEANGLYNLNAYDENYFNQLRNRVAAAQANGLYISVMLFNGWSIQQRSTEEGDDPWLGHPFHINNNSTWSGGFNPDIDGDGGEEVHALIHSEVTAVQKAYVERVVQELNQFDNIIWEICNECGDSHNQISKAATVEWMEDMADHIRTLEGAEGMQQHLIWLSAPWGGANAELLASSAEVVAVSGGVSHHQSPPANDPSEHEKIVILDSDHIDNPSCVDWEPGRELWCGYAWPWKVFTRGYNAALMDTVRTVYPIGPIGPADPVFDPPVEATRFALGQTARYGNEVIQNLAGMQPSEELIVSQIGGEDLRYVLANQGQEYLVFRPESGLFELELLAGNYAYHWFDIQAENGIGAIINSDALTVSADGAQAFESTGPNHVLYIVNDQPDVEPVITLTATPTEITLGQTTVFAWNVQNAAAGSCIGFLNNEQLPEPLSLPSGSFSYTPTATSAFEVECNWSMGVVSDSVTVTVTVTGVDLIARNDPGEGDPSLTFTAPQASYEVPYALLFSNDEPSEGITIAERRNLTEGVLTDGVEAFTYEPPVGFIGGEVTFEYAITSDGMDRSNFALVTMNIPAIPSIIARDDPDETAVLNSNGVNYRLLHSKLVDNDSHSDLVLIEIPEGLYSQPSVGSLSLDGGVGPNDVRFKYTPPNPWSGGTVTFTYQSRERADHSKVSNVATVTMHVPALPGPAILVANDDPDLTIPDLLTFPVAQGQYSFWQNILFINDTIDGGSASGAAVSIHPDEYTLIDTNAGELTRTTSPPYYFHFTPATGFAGGEVRFTYQFRYLSQTSPLATATMTLPATPPVLTAVNDNVGLLGLASVYDFYEADLITNDIAPPGDTVSVSSIDQPTIPPGANIEHFPNETPQRFRMTPPADYDGDMVRFDYTITADNGGGGSTATARLWPLIANDDGPFTTCDLPIEIRPLDNDKGYSLSIYEIVQAPQGEVSISRRPPRITYTPPSNGLFVGDDSFSYRAIDKAGNLSAEAWVQVNVLSSFVCMGGSLTAIDDALNLMVNVDGFVDFSHSQLLANDTSGGPSVWIDEPSVTQPDSGTLETIPESDPPEFRYTPPAGFIGGEVVFQYAITDGSTVSNQATVTLSISQSEPDIEILDFTGKYKKDNISNLTIADFTPAIELSWSEPSHPAGLEKYQIVLENTVTGQVLNSFEVTAPANEHTLETSRLKPGVSYQIKIRVKANGPVEWGPYAETGTFKARLPATLIWLLAN